jgi:L,D-peptidoglycan transpeptidase YkuD (ErfK/YbiS/YcfS/YnhG family)
MDALPRQVVMVDASDGTVVVTAFEQAPFGNPAVALGPFAAVIGRAGLAAPGSKQEGDGRTPIGRFALRGGFGTRPDPGVSIGWRQVDHLDRWVDDPASTFYNTWQRAPDDGRWTSAETLLQPEYGYAQVIGVNEARVPGAGSAIFMHVAGRGATEGCVALAENDLLALLRWQRPGAVLVVTASPLSP